MGDYQVVFFEKADGECPAEDFIDRLSDKMAAKIYRLLEMLSHNGPALREPYSKHLTDGIFELRAQAGSDISRILYFFCIGKRIVVTHGFLKKTQKTPPREIMRAKAYRQEYMNQEEFK